MKIFISSTYTDLVEERLAVQKVLSPPEWTSIGMELFPSEPTTPLDAALHWLGEADAVVLLIGFKAGSLAPRGAGLTFTRAEFDDAQRLRKPLFVFVRMRESRCKLLRLLGNKPRWRNEERDPRLRKALDELKHDACSVSTAAYWKTTLELRHEVFQAFVAWENRGLPGARRTFADWAEVFDQPGSPSKLFDYDQTLCGRAAHQQIFQAFLEKDESVVGLLPGRGGIGKSKLLRDWTRHIADWEVLFLRDQAVWRPETLKEVPAARTLILADDAHRTGHLEDLLALVKDLHDSGRTVKVLLAYRPSGDARIRSALSRRFEPYSIAEFPTLDALAPAEVRALACEVLGPDHQRFVTWLAAMIGDTPLVTVIGGRLVRSGGILPDQLGSEAEFRKLVFDRYLEEYELGLPNDSFPYRELLYLVSALGPLTHRSGDFAAQAARFIGSGQPLRADQVLSAIDLFERRGLFRVTGSTVRVVPDVLSDHLLEQRCTDSHGQSTWYADALYAEFGEAHLRELLQNLSELDWRIGRSAPSSQLLAGIWKSLTEQFRMAGAIGRRELLKNVGRVAFLQPDQAMGIVSLALGNPAADEQPYGPRWTVGQREVERELPGILEAVAYHPNYTDQAIRLLWDLATKDERPPNQYPEGAVRILKKLTAYDRYLSPAFNLHIAEIVGALALAPNALDGEFTPFDLVDVLLETEGEFHETVGFTLTIGSFGLPYDAIRPARDRALRIAFDALDATDTRAGVRAVRSLVQLLYPSPPKFGRLPSSEEIAWQNAEMLRVLEALKTRIAQLPLPVLREVLWTLRSFVGWPNAGQVKAKAEGVLAAIPQSAELTILDAFFTTQSQWRGRDWRAADVRRAEYVAAAIRLFHESHQSVGEQVAAVESMFQLGVSVRFDMGGFGEFLFRLNNEEEFALAFAELLLRHAPPGMGHLIQAPIQGLRAVRSNGCLSIAERAATAPDAAITRGCAAAFAHIGTMNPSVDDVGIIERLCASRDVYTSRSALNALASFNTESPLRDRVVAIAVGTDIKDDQHLAEQLCDVFAPHAISPAVLRPEEREALLSKLIPIRAIDEYSIEQLLEYLVAQHPDELFEFLMKRVAHGSALVAKEGVDMGRPYDAVPSRSSWPRSQTMTQQPNREQRLAQILDAKLANALYQRELTLLFWQFGPLDSTTLSVLDDWVRSGDPRGCEVVVDLLQKGPREIAFLRPYFALRLLDICQELKPELGNEAIGALAWNAHPDVPSSIPGSPPSALVSVQQRADALAEQFSFSPTATKLYRAIADHARWTIKNVHTEIHEASDAG